MTGKRGQKAALLDWANDQNQLDRTAKSVLKELASYADADCCAWAKVATLGYGVNASERTIQYHLRALQDGGLIRDTGRAHRLEGSTRSVPIYQLAPEAEGLGRPVSMGAEIAPILGHGCKTDGAMGATGLHPQETIGDQEVADATSPSASGREALFRELVDASPKGLLKFVDLEAAFLAFGALADDGVEVAELPGCARRMAADPAFVSRKFPAPLQDWLSKGQFMGWWPEPEGAARAAAEVEVAAMPIGAAGPEFQAIWAAVLATVRPELRSGDYLNYLAPAMLGVGPDGLPVVVARTGIGRDALRACMPKVREAWDRADPQGRPLGLTSKSEFEAQFAPQREGAN